MTMRLSASSFAGTARTLVAVGSSSEACMFLAIAPAAPRSGLTVTSSASSPWAFAGVVDPAAGLASPDVSAAGRVLVAPLADAAGCGFVADADDDGAEEDAADEEDVDAGCAPFALLPPRFAVDDGVLVLPLLDALPADGADDADDADGDPPAEAPPDEPPPAVAAPVDEAELAPAVFSPSAGA